MGDRTQDGSRDGKGWIVGATLNVLRSRIDALGFFFQTQKIDHMAINTKSKIGANGKGKRSKG